MRKTLKLAVLVLALTASPVVVGADHVAKGSVLRQINLRDAGRAVGQSIEGDSR